MKAVICSQYGSADVLELQDIEKPTVKSGEVLVKIMASSTTAADSMMRQGVPVFGRLFLGLRKPKFPITGTGFAGIIEELGEGVKNYKVGDKVFGESALGAGTNAEYVCVSQDAVLMPMPANISFEEAAPLCDGALTSINFLQDVSHIKPGQRVLINGAAGSLGTAAVQLAKHYGAHVIGVCSTQNISLVKSLGAHEVIDYTRQDFCNNAGKYNIIYDTVGKRHFNECKKVLEEDGEFISPVLNLKLLFQMLFTSIFKGKKAKFSATGIRPPQELRKLLEQLIPLIESGKLKTHIDKRFSLSQIKEAHQYVDSGHKRGNVVIMEVIDNKIQNS